MRIKSFWLSLFATFVCFAGAAWLLAQPIAAQGATAGSPLHPAFALLDADGANVLDSAQPISTMKTCGTCHDTTFIASHSFHVDVGLGMATGADTGAWVHSWDTSPGTFGRWNPILYRYLSAPGDTRVDLTTADWVMAYGLRHVGGGPAEISRTGQPLTAIDESAPFTESMVVNPATGELIAWDWQKSGVVEMNCFLCHTAAPNNAARIEALAAGQFQWANTATLFGTGIVESNISSYTYNQDAFSADGNLRSELITLQDPTSANCGACHGVVQVTELTPVNFTQLTLSDWTTLTTGQIFSPDRIVDSALNLSDKDSLTHAWDVHAERVLGCTDCHFALNNPVYYQDTSADKPEHLVFDPRRLDFGEYLYRPLHQFAKGQSAQSALAPEYDNSLRRCDSCHSVEATHDWLPYKERHTEKVACETCHIPQLHAPALASIDWTIITPEGQPVTTYRGTENGQSPESGALITGFTPVVLPRQNADGSLSLAPFNLVTSWYWVYGDPARPVPLRDLQAAYLQDGVYQNDVLSLFDTDQNGALDAAELRVDTPEKTALIAGHLTAAGLSNPRMVGEIQPYNITHDVVSDEWAVRDCQTCHSENSWLNQPLLLAETMPHDVPPVWVNAVGVMTGGSIAQDDSGAVLFTLSLDVPEVGYYIFGHDAIWWVDWLGILMFLGVLVVVSLHGGLRYLAARRLAAQHPTALRPVYMYSVYERFWHWLQTMVILGLAFTGLVVHKPDKFALFDFGFVVVVHNILAVILVVNAALSLFYHLVSGEIRQYIPRPYGFFDQAIQQAKYYLWGIFRGAPHPFEKVPERKLNPLQQLTYFGILNVLLPLQVITGALMWGAQHFPAITAQLGGLPFLAPFHTLIAWTFVSFVVAHVYLTTTGHTPLANIKAMMLGWEDVEGAGTAAHGTGESTSGAAPANGD